MIDTPKEKGLIEDVPPIVMIITLVVTSVVFSFIFFKIYQQCKKRDDNIILAKLESTDAFTAGGN